MKEFVSVAVVVVVVNYIVNLLTDCSRPMKEFILFLIVIISLLNLQGCSAVQIKSGECSMNVITMFKTADGLSFDACGVIGTVSKTMDSQLIDKALKAYMRLP